MFATRVSWVTALASGVIVAVLAVSAAGFYSMTTSGPHTSSAGPAGSWHGGGWTNGTYNVTFNESGLPAGTFWSVSVRGTAGFWESEPSSLEISPLGWGGSNWNGSKNSSIGFHLRNGSYDFSVAPTRNGSTVYAASPSSGNLTVNGTGAVVVVSFSTVTFFNVTLTESGLPEGAFWSASLRDAARPGGWTGYGGWFSHGGFEWNGTTNSSLNFSEPNGAYLFAVGPVWVNGTIYVADPDRGNLTVNGSAVSEAITFAPLTEYNVTFVETGLPNGTNWSVGIFGWYGGSGWNRSSGSTITFTRPDGQYGFAVAPVWNSTGVFLATPHWGQVEVDGANATVDVAFAFSSESY
jgi:hypothetical protein